MPERTDTDKAAAKVIAECGGDARAAVKSLVVLLDLYEREVIELNRQLDRAAMEISASYVRQRFRERLP